MTQSAALQVTNIGVESTKGTLVAATKRLRSLSIEPNINPDISEFQAEGSLVNNLTVLNREWATANVTGQPTYDELIYPLSSVIGKVTPTQPDAENAASAYLWDFEADANSEQDPATFTVEKAGPDRSYRFGYGLFNAFNLNIARTGITLGGSMIGKAIEDGITPTAEASLAMMPLVPVLPSEVSVYVDAAAEDIGTTQVLRDFVANLTIPARYDMIWPLDASLESFGGHVPIPIPGTQMMLQFERNAVGMGFLPTMRAGSTRYIRVEAVGATIEGDVTYKLTVDFAGNVTGGSFGENNNLATVDWTFTAIDDSDLGFPFRLAVQNTQSTL